MWRTSSVLGLFTYTFPYPFCCLLIHVNNAPAYHRTSHLARRWTNGWSLYSLSWCYLVACSAVVVETTHEGRLSLSLSLSLSQLRSCSISLHKSIEPYTHSVSVSDSVLYDNLPLTYVKLGCSIQWIYWSAKGRCATHIAYNLAASSR